MPKDDVLRTLLIAIPMVTAAASGIVAWVVASSRMRARLDAKLRELERRAAGAEAASAMLGKKVEALKSDMIEETRDALETSLYRFFTDIKTRLNQSSDIASVRQIVERGFHAAVQNIEELRKSLGHKIEPYEPPASPAAPAAGVQAARTEPRYSEPRVITPRAPIDTSRVVRPRAAANEVGADDTVTGDRRHTMRDTAVDRPRNTER
jgi:hypothetical protein